MDCMWSNKGVVFFGQYVFFFFFLPLSLSGVDMYVQLLSNIYIFKYFPFVEVCLQRDGELGDRRSIRREDRCVALVICYKLLSVKIMLDAPQTRVRRLCLQWAANNIH